MDFLNFLFFVNNILLTFVLYSGVGADVMCNDGTNDYWIDDKICGEVCPSQFIQDVDRDKGQLCNLPSSNAELFELKFWMIQNLSQTSITSSINSADNWENPFLVPYNSPTNTSPLPTRSRGFYFTSSSSIASNQPYIPSLYFTAALWITAITPGKILTVRAESTNYIELVLDDHYFAFNILAKTPHRDSDMPKITSIADSVWQYVLIQINQIDSDTIKLVIAINEDPGSIPNLFEHGYEARFPNKVYNWTIGKSDETSFNGFLYWIKGWNVLYHYHWSPDFSQLCNIRLPCNNFDEWRVK
ncbi:unnamed protein product [Blepharisma stoltei]|uniref:Uncharacterized protein n=1 Tax=Blepharisma stoltei TaxID=1481888 RepID=A0AAU9KCK0_9CILI|nr:unnamed protein product [Blepharisma stoltei]